MKTGSTNWGLALLTAATLAVVLPFLAFLVVAIVSPESPAQRSVAAARPTPAAAAVQAPNRAVAPAGEVRKRRT